MKIVSDFDGVFTNPVGEAAAIFEDFIMASESQAGLSREAVLNVRARQSAEPWKHGWPDAGRVSAFCDEDPFIALIALSQELGLRDIASQCFHNVRASALHVDDRALAAAHALVKAGHELVIVSNSSPERIERIVGERFPKGVRVRGNASKFATTPTAPTLDVGRYKVPLERPAYHSILVDEKPDLVIGDVFTLDLSYPLQLRAKGMLPNVRVALVERPYTPAWSKAYVRGLSDWARVVAGFAEAVE